MANEDMRLSAKGHAPLAHTEAVRSTYYDDEGHNCTCGQGQLVHCGPRSLHELNSTVTEQMIDAARDNSIASSKQIVKAAVRRHSLTQD